MKSIKKPKILNLIIAIIIGLSYPTIKYYTLDANKFLGFLDSLTIIGFVYLIAGIFVSIYNHGDLDGIIFRMQNPKISDNASFKDYKERKKKERENSFNYPLFLGIFFVVLSYILATFFY